MIFDISDSNFKKILNDDKLFLPIRWEGNDFSQTLERLFNYYINKLKLITDNESSLNEIEKVCAYIVKSVDYYLDGFPSKSYSVFKNAIYLLMRTPLKIYQKSIFEQFEYHNKFYNDKLNLFRAVNVNDNIQYGRTRVFHTPYNLRSKISTNRYSIAGYPSLYLSTSLDLCCEEIHTNPKVNLTLASRFKIERSIEYNDTVVEVIELALKPQDFIFSAQNREQNRRVFDEITLSNEYVRNTYLLWYPLIAACSYIRINKNDPFAVEYIIPQLLMQWVREVVAHKEDGYDKLVGIRYFSCASVKASDMGFNYVFPVSGQQYSYEYPYCPVLMKAFRLTTPLYINEYNSIYDCERILNKSNDLEDITAV